MLDILLFLLTLVVALSSAILPMGLILGVTMPFVGVILRYRANYSPKSLQLTDDDGMPKPPQADHELGSPNSFFGMIKRVYKLEGWTGFYKGIMPSLLTSLMAMVVTMPLGVFIAIERMPGGPNIIGHMGPGHVGIVFWILSATLSVLLELIFLPMQIITNRAITTPHKLNPFAPKVALRVLLSPAEFAAPAKLYLAPGVFFVQVLLALARPALSILTQFTFLRMGRGLPGVSEISVELAVLLVIAVLLTPLQVMSARLTLQRRGEDVQALPTAVDPDAPPPYAITEEVMQFRTQDYAPYTSLYDCGKQIIREEGWRVLFRAWWVSFLGLLIVIRIRL
ncbi:hypothetical protein C8J57DRAFT_1273900 [Mycena rebaudengoi]|nr:hypothetical protein C8J57DRAFT_1273900 [Mycena rebaudengoi]